MNTPLRARLNDEKKIIFFTVQLFRSINNFSGGKAREIIVTLVYLRIKSIGYKHGTNASS